jgi:hypothetical protein
MLRSAMMNKRDNDYKETVINDGIKSGAYCGGVDFMDMMC